MKVRLGKWSQVMSDPSPIVPQVGQIWADMDYRMRGRTFRIDALSPCGKYALVTTLTAGAMTAAPGTSTRIRVDRLKPGSTGYQLVLENSDAQPYHPEAILQASCGPGEVTVKTDMGTIVKRRVE